MSEDLSSVIRHRRRVHGYKPQKGVKARYEYIQKPIPEVGERLSFMLYDVSSIHPFPLNEKDSLIVPLQGARRKFAPSSPLKVKVRPQPPCTTGKSALIRGYTGRFLEHHCDSRFLI
jgi:hypothetical protein